MSGWYEQAKDKLEQGVKEVKGHKEGTMKDDVKGVLLNFCRQTDEFAQAVVQGGTFPECMTAVAKGVGSHISDLDAYKRAVSFYFPGAGINMTMTIDLGDGAESETSRRSSGVILNLSDLW